MYLLELAGVVLHNANMENMTNSNPIVTIRGMRRLTILSAVAATLLMSAQLAPAASISFVSQFKNDSFLQTGNGNTLSNNGSFFSADLFSTVSNAYSTVSMSYPGAGSPVSLPQVATTQYHYQTASLTNQAAMDAAFPFGTYTYSASNGGPADVASDQYTSNDYALSNPYLTGTDYSSLQGMNSAQAFTFHFSPFTTGAQASASFIFFTIYDNTTSAFVVNDAFLTPGTTSQTVGAGTLQAGHSYTYELDFSNRDLIASPGAVSQAQLGFDLRTDGNFTTANTPEPSTIGFVVLGLGMIAAKARRRG